MPEIDGAAVAEPEAIAGAGETAETGSEIVETGQEPVDTVDSSTEKQGLTEKTGTKGKLSVKEVAQKSADALKAIDPALPGTLRAMDYELSGYKREFPGGPKEAAALKTSISEFGGLEGIKESVETVAEFGALARAFFDGKPDFVDNLIKESPAAFAQMMPDSIAKWKQIDQAGFEHSIARSIVDTLKPEGISETLAAIHNALDPEKGKEMRAELARLYNVFEGIKAKAEKAPERKVDPKEEQLTQREQSLNQKERDIAMKPVTAAGKAQITEILDREMMQGYQWDKTDGDVKQAVKSWVESEMAKVLGKDKEYLRERDRFRERGDYEGLTRHIKATQERAMPHIIERVARLFAVKPKNAGTPIKKPVVSSNGTSGEVDEGWVRISTQPKASEIDYGKMGRNADDMIMDGKAILKSGRKVQWA